MDSLRFVLISIFIPSTKTVVGTKSPIRLVDGTTRYEGRVEIYHNYRWGSICDDRFGTQDARVVCRSLGFSAVNAIAYQGARFGKNSEEIWLDDVSCTGTEQYLDQCSLRDWGDHNCRHAEDVSVTCEGTARKSIIRLVNGRTRYEGRVEIYHDGQWGSVCDDSFGAPEAKVVCRSLGLPSTKATAYSGAQFGSSTGPIWLDDVNCQGYEEYLDQCSLPRWGINNCGHSEDVGVICDGVVRKSLLRLVNGRTSYEGRVEVYHDGQWGSICDDSFGAAEAKVVCRSLGLPSLNAIAYGNGHFEMSSGPIWLDDVNCNGGEKYLDQCSLPAWGNHNCNHGEDVGVHCQVAKVRLVNGRGTVSEGRVEVLMGGTWGTVCDDNFDEKDAAVVCAMMGYSRSGAQVIKYTQYGRGTGPIHFDEVKCTGTENSIVDCLHDPVGKNDCTHSEDVGVKCQRNVETDSKIIRLVDGHGETSQGRIEILINGSWGTVCDDSFDKNDAAVVCAMLGFSRSGAEVARFGGGDGPIHFDDLDCSGNEASITECLSNPTGKNDCTHTEDVGVKCKTDSASNAGKIAGGICGGLLFVALVVALVIFRKKIKKFISPSTPDQSVYLINVRPTFEPFSTHIQMNQLQEYILCCPICCENYEDTNSSLKYPRLLSCQHTFCVECLQQMLGQSSSIECPLDRRMTYLYSRNVNDLRENRTVLDMLGLAATQYGI